MKIINLGRRSQSLITQFLEVNMQTYSQIDTWDYLARANGKLGLFVKSLLKHDSNYHQMQER